MQNQTIAVFGGTGFVGSALTADLTRAGHNVRIASRRPERHRQLQVAPRARVERVNPYSDSALRAFLADCTGAVNLVGILNERGRDGKEFRRVHTELPERIARACAEAGVGRLVHVSALRADAEKGPSQYLRSKGEGEARLRRVAAETSLGISILQPSVVFGRDDSFTNRFAGLLKLPVPFMPLPRPNARFAPVFVKDLRAAISVCLDDPDTAGKTFQLCGPQVFSLREIVELIAESIGVDKPIFNVPDALARFQAAIMDFVPGKPFSTDNYRSLLVNSICENDGFSRLGISPRAPSTLIPRLLGGDRINQRYARYRERAGRD